METTELLKYEWVNLSQREWRKIPCSEGKSNSGYYHEDWRSKGSILIFTESVFRDVARQLGVSYDEIAPILKEQNSAFYQDVDRIFSDCTLIRANYFKCLRNYFIIPDVEKISKMRLLQANVENGVSAISWWRNIVEIAERLFSSNTKKALPAPSEASLKVRIANDFLSLSKEEQLSMLQELQELSKKS